VQPGETWYFQISGTPEATTTGSTTGTTGTTTGGTTTSTGTSTTGDSTSTGTSTTGTTTGTSTTGTSTTGTSSTGTSTTGGSTGTSTSTSTGGTPAVAMTTASTASGNLVFNVTTLEIVPIDMTLTIDPRGTVTAAGDFATVTGMITCSRTAPTSVVVTLAQLHTKRYVANASGGSDGFECGPAARPWTVTIYNPGPIRYGSGDATADAWASACDDHGCGSVNVYAIPLTLKYIKK
jgi:hypothetical protein